MSPADPPIAAAASARPSVLTRANVAAAVILAVALAARLSGNGRPPLGPHDFRQTQTAITVQAWLDHGFTLLDYETPVFGPPWRVPFEFPTYQASAWVLAKAGMRLDRACRTASLVWFFASALLLRALARRYAGEVAALVALAVYVLSPFSLLWGRAILIDYASVALALGYLLATASWAERPRGRTAAVAVALGVLLALTKLTTLPVVAPGLLLAAIAALRRARRDGGGIGATLAVLAALAIAPIGAGALWTRYADAVKAASPATTWLTSKALYGWNFGTLDQRLTLACWEVIASRMGWILPGVLAVLIGPALGTIWRRRGALRAAAVAAAGGLLLAPLVFFNLYWVHDYYLIAVTPCLALLAGIGAAEVLALAASGRAVVLEIAAFAVLVSGRVDWAYASPAYADTRKDPLMDVAWLVSQNTPPESWVVVQGDDWSPRIPYLARRRAVMVRPPFVSLDVVAGRREVAAVVCAQCADVLPRWGRTELLGERAGFSVYKVAEPVASPLPSRTGPLDSNARIP